MDNGRGRAVKRPGASAPATVRPGGLVRVALVGLLGAVEDGLVLQTTAERVLARG